MKSKLNRRKENKVYIGIIVTLGVLLGVFLTSKSWMYDDSAIAQTPYNESINGLNQTTLILRSWEYNPKNQLMEVTIETVHTGTDAVEPTFTFEAKGKESKETYPAKKVYESDNVMVIHIEHVPTEYRVIGLFVTEHRDDKILKQEYKRQLENDSDVATTETDKIEKSDLPKPEDVIIVGDYREIEVNKNLVAKSDKAYQREVIATDMERIKQEISTIIDENIPFQQELIATLTKEKTSLKNEMEFETKEEQTETEKEIDKKENAISSAEEEIEAYKSKVKELKEKYDNREEKLDKLLHPERQSVEENQESKEQKQQQEAKKKHEKHQNQDAKKQDKNKKDESKKEQKRQQQEKKNKDEPSGKDGK
ncbi:hypothetical protein OPHB3_2392 [Oceanobacillus picturae]|uniref:Uncharacterized protein n=1 Tax=Oceanobacillus picturae TaxID=171693 RepID=A0A0U9HEE7_9BACI|nr:hypothetical protein [Oceanobacillus picturae]GAQ18452.1 hypothetical protein OPHB3_2392 [Oceanobacillus picturae]